jgi:serine protease Do
MKLANPLLAVTVVFALLTVTTAQAQSERDKKVLADRADVLAAGDWIYNDLTAGIEKAKASGKPLLIVLRCIP